MNKIDEITHLLKQVLPERIHVLHYMVQYGKYFQTDDYLVRFEFSSEKGEPIQIYSITGLAMEKASAGFIAYHLFQQWVQEIWKL